MSDGKDVDLVNQNSGEVFREVFVEYHHLNIKRLRILFYS